MSISVLDSIKNIVSGDSIKIQDEIYTIVSVTDIYLNDYVLIFAELKNTMDEKCFLLFKEYEENEFEFEIFYELEDFPQGKNREEVIEKGFVDLFAPPPDPHDFKPCELYLAMDIYSSDDIRYRQHIDTVYGEVCIDEGEYQLGSLNLWECARDETKINQLTKILCLEIGGIDQEGEPLDEGPRMFMYEGHKIDSNLIKIG